MVGFRHDDGTPDFFTPMDIAPGEYTQGMDTAKEGADYSVEMTRSDDEGLRELIKRAFILGANYQIGADYKDTPESLAEDTFKTAHNPGGMQAAEAEALISQKIIKARLGALLEALEFREDKERDGHSSENASFLMVGRMGKQISELQASLTTKQDIKESDE